MAFEIASVKPGEPGKSRPASFPLSADDSYGPTGGHFSADLLLMTYIQFAYKLWMTRDQVESILAHMPGWVASQNFEIEARAPGNPTKDQMRLMMQSLLADRFKLAVHFEDHEGPVLALTLVKPGKMGPRLRPHSDGPGCDATDPDVFPETCDAYAVIGRANGMREVGSRNTTMDVLAQALPFLGNLGRPVLNRTGLDGRFDFTLDWSPEPGGDPSSEAPKGPDLPGPSFLQVLREQLGLKLESTRGAVRTLLVDHIERPSEN
jgi:uncharacterized protein (TIGR03435 family)